MIFAALPLYTSKPEIYCRLEGIIKYGIPCKSIVEYCCSAASSILVKYEASILVVLIHGIFRMQERFNCLKL
jgi:hypothetical protein